MHRMTRVVDIHDLFPSSFPISMTGANLNDLNKVVAGKLTYLSASYWHHELNMLEIDGKENS